MKHTTLFSGLLCALVLSFTASASWAEPHCEACPYDCEDLGLGRKDCSELPGRGGVCCVDLSKKGLKLVAAQDEAEDSAVADEPCPPGFQERERSCSQQERANGCHDVRLNSGKGCVKVR